MKHSISNSRPTQYIPSLWIIIGVVFFFLYIKFTYPKAIFLVQLLQLTELSQKNATPNGALLGKLYAQNSQLQPLIGSKQEKDQDFLNAFLEESTRKNRINDLIRNKEYQSLKPIISREFPENLYLEYFGFYSQRNQKKEWQNFDSLFMNMVRSPHMNSLSELILAEAIKENRISPPVLFNLIHYINWQNNLKLSNKLLFMSRKMDLLSEEQRDLLSLKISARKILKASLDKNKINRKHIAEVLKSSLYISNDEIHIGQNMIHDGNFEQKNSISHYWLFAIWSNDELFSKGSYFGGHDHSENQSMRITGFFSEDTDKRSPSRGGFYYKKYIRLETKLYLIYFRYKTLTDNESPSIWLSDTLKTEYRLDPTGEMWKKVFLLVNNQQIQTQEIRPLFRMWGTGTVWFDDIFISEIEIPDKTIESYWIHIK